MNLLLGIASILTFLFVVWPGFGGEMATKWVVGIAAVVVLLIAIFGVTCKPCAARKKK